MGCVGSRPIKVEAVFLEIVLSFLHRDSIFSSRTENREKQLQKPKPWKHTPPITQTQLRKMREEFWDTAPHYGGQKEIWDALRAAAEADLDLAQAIVDSAEIIVSNADMTLCYDERGAKYELPKYVLSEPTNLLGDD